MAEHEPILIPISIGELVDKVSILMIKQQKINDPLKLIYINKELTLLKAVCKKNKISLENELFVNLLQCNHSLWVIEDAIRIKEKSACFDEEFISLARSVYLKNDERFQIKKKINLAYQSELQEEKSYR